MAESGERDRGLSRNVVMESRGLPVISRSLLISLGLTTSALLVGPRFLHAQTEGPVVVGELDVSGDHPPVAMVSLTGPGLGVGRSIHVSNDNRGFELTVPRSASGEFPSGAGFHLVFYSYWNHMDVAPLAPLMPGREVRMGSFLPLRSAQTGLAPEDPGVGVLTPKTPGEARFVFFRHLAGVPAPGTLKVQIGKVGGSQALGSLELLDDGGTAPRPDPMGEAKFSGDSLAGDGIHTAVFTDLPSGRYMYRFFVDHKSMEDPLGIQLEGRVGWSLIVVP